MAWRIGVVSRYYTWSRISETEKGMRLWPNIFENTKRALVPNGRVAMIESLSGQHWLTTFNSLNLAICDGF